MGLVGGTLGEDGGDLIGSEGKAGTGGGDGGGVFAAGGNTVLTGYLSIGHTDKNVGMCSVADGALSVADTLYVGYYGTGHLDVGPSGSVTATPAYGLQVREGTLTVHDGGVISVRQLYYNGGSRVAAVTFDGGVLKPTGHTTGSYATGFIRGFNDITIRTGGLSIQTTGKNLGMNGCTVKVAPGSKIAITGGGTFLFSDTTFSFAAKPTTMEQYVLLAKTDGTFSGLPSFNDTFKTGRKLKMSADGKRLYLIPRGFAIFVK